MDGSRGRKLTVDSIGPELFPRKESVVEKRPSATESCWSMGMKSLSGERSGSVISRSVIRGFASRGPKASSIHCSRSAIMLAIEVV